MPPNKRVSFIETNYQGIQSLLQFITNFYLAATLNDFSIQEFEIYMYFEKTRLKTQQGSDDFLDFINIINYNLHVSWE